jgi:hypothetical protein
MHFLSVAEHSVVVSRFINPCWAREGLMHDPAEALTGDLVKPIKEMQGFGAFKRLEERLNRELAKRFDLRYPWPDQVGNIDERAMVSEVKQLLPSGDYEHVNGRRKPLPHTYDCWDSERAEREFLKQCRALGIT